VTIGSKCWMASTLSSIAPARCRMGFSTICMPLRKGRWALYETARDRELLIVQISAETENPGRDIAVLGTKRQADAALAASGIPYASFVRRLSSAAMRMVAPRC
jgi:hypothetical protein